MDDIQDDLLYNVLQCLEPADLARLAGTCRKFKNDHDKISQLIWNNHVCSKWGLGRDQTVMCYPVFNTAQLRSFYPNCSRMISGIVSDHTDIKFDQTTLTAEFVGRIGENNRSIQGSDPFPVSKGPEDERSSFYESMMSFANKIAVEFLKECDFPDLVMDDGEESDVVRYSIPFARNIADGSIQYCVKPRFISYYEVQIKPPTQPHLLSEAEFECVAVGLATKSFMKNKRLPGWDMESFGYHGDDGAIFHGQGKQLSEFGPRYGCNDTIGCGLNHRDNSIFFTLNGKMLGTAFREVPSDVELYPTVGIDTNCVVQLNFGKRPFAFDLLGYVESIDS